MLLTTSVILVLAVASGVECVRNTPRSARASRNEGSLDFECPEEFGYYPHPRDCTQYYVCVFGGALLESCTGGLMYSHELQTCDWPRNVGCLNGGSIAKETVEDDPLLERAAKAESVELQQQPQHHQSRQQQRQPIQRQQSQVSVTSSSPPVSQITERQQSRHRQQQPQHQHRTYEDVEYEPATEIESDRQQRVYRGQPSTIGQVQRDRDGLRRNIISVSHPPSPSSSSSSSSSTSPLSSTLSLPIEVSTVTPRKDVFSKNKNVVSKAATRRDRVIDERTNDPSTIGSVESPIPRRFDYTTEKRESDFDDAVEKVSSTEVSTLSTRASTFSQLVTFDGTKITKRPDIVRQSSRVTSSTLRLPNEASTLSLSESDDYEFAPTGGSRSISQQPQSRMTETSFASPTSIASHWQRSSEDFEKNEISVTTTAPDQRATNLSSSPGSDEGSTDQRETATGGYPRNQRQRTRTDHLQSSSISWLRTSDELERNEISVSPGTAGRGFMIKRLRSEPQDSTGQYDGDSGLGVTESYAIRRATTADDKLQRHDIGESRNFEVSIDPTTLIRQRSRDNLVSTTFQSRPTEKSTTDATRVSLFDSARRAAFDEPENRKYYAVTIPVSYSTDDDRGIVGTAWPRNSVDYTRTRKVPVNPIQLNITKGDTKEKKYYIPSVQQPRGRRTDVESADRRGGNDLGDRSARFDITDPTASNFTTEQLPRRVLQKLPFADVGPEVPSAERKYRGGVRTTTTVTTTTTSVSASIAGPEDPSRNEVSPGSSPSGRRSNVGFATSVAGGVDGVDTNETEGNEIPSSNVPSSNGPRGRQRAFVRGQSRHRTQEEVGRTSRPEREKDSVVNTRGQTETHYRAISSESPRIVKTTVSTSAPISKSYYNDPDQSYPYYTIYDDDVSIYKDDDYAQYTVNRSVQIPQQQHLQHHQHQHQNVRIAEVTPNSNQYSQKPKKVAVNDADKYNLNPEVTVSDYDIYDNQPLKNKFRISDGQQSLRTNGLSHPVVHATTPNAIVDNYVPLTTTTQPPPTTTVRPYTVTLQNRGRPQVNRGTAPPRLRPTLKPSTAIVSKAQEFVDIYRYPPVRPGPIYPTPTVDKPAAKCRKDVCLLPDCNCGGSDIPGDYLPEEIPQIVLLTFDDSVNDLNKGLYADLFEKGRKNPNGCPISATFYVSHEWTDYSQVQNLYAAGHEIASHTVSHSFGEQFSARKWSREVAGQREILAAYGGVKLEDVRGMRAPFLSVGGNNMFKMLWDTNFTYDSSMPIYENRPPSWPYTLDYKLFHDCMIPPCPTRSYPGLWEVPMVMWQDLNGGRCSMGDACSNPPTPDGVYKMLIKNFERHYTTNRAPFGLFYHAAWFTQPHHKEGFISFLDTIVAMDDVWVITNWQAIQWVRNPTPLELLDRFEPFGCNYPDRPKKCNNAKVCNLWHKSGVRYMKTCQACPDIYPWTGKTGIRSSRIDNEIEN